MTDELNLLPGVPEDYVRTRLSAAGGNEVASGKFASSDSSAALAVNAFAWFHHQPELLPALPGTEEAGWPAACVEVEYCPRFPWAGGHHPWLDAFVVTSTHIIGIESKRHEPFRDDKSIELSPAFDRPVWGADMGRFEAMRDSLRAGTRPYVHLDAAQLVKHAFGLVTEARRITGRHPVLLYLYAEPARWATDVLRRHRHEIEDFDQAVQGAAVGFVAARWQDWLVRWARSSSTAVRGHGERLSERFGVGSSTDRL